MWGAKGPFLPEAAMVVMVVVGSWSLGHISTVGIVYIFMVQRGLRTYKLFWTEAS
jgi:hypothetical protein